MKSMPPDWVPPVDAWQAAYPDAEVERVFGYFGIQSLGGKTHDQFAQRFLASVSTDHGPGEVDQAEFRDASGFDNLCIVAYWDDLGSFEAWWASSEFGSWWDSPDRLHDVAGVWREVFGVAPARFETLSSTRQAKGIAKLGNEFGDPVREHNYWGGMRDRMAAAHEDKSGLAGTLVEEKLESRLIASRQARLRVTVPDNLCLIRSGQDLRECPPDELATYCDVVRPHLVAGMDYLRDNAADSGCISSRLLTERGEDSQSPLQTFGLALFVSMAHLERWSSSHPSHLAIFKSFFKMVETHAGQLKLRLWHEVLVCRSETTTCEYVNCHPRTGLLPYFPAN